MKRIQAKKHKIGTCEIDQISLSCFDDKRYMLDDGVNTLAYFLIVIKNVIKIIIIMIIIKIIIIIMIIIITINDNNDQWYSPLKDF